MAASKKKPAAKKSTTSKEAAGKGSAPATKAVGKDSTPATKAADKDSTPATKAAAKDSTSAKKSSETKKKEPRAATIVNEDQEASDENEAETGNDTESDAEQPSKKHRPEVTPVGISDPSSVSLQPTVQAPFARPRLPRQATKWTIPALSLSYNHFVDLFNDPWIDIEFSRLLQGQAQFGLFNNQPMLSYEFSKLIADPDHKKAVVWLGSLGSASEETRARVLGDGLVRKVLRASIAIYLAARFEARPYGQWRLICDEDIENVKQITPEYLEAAGGRLPSVPPAQDPAPFFPAGREASQRWASQSPAPTAPHGASLRREESRASARTRPDPRTDSRANLANYLRLLREGLVKVPMAGRCYGCLRLGHTNARCPLRHPDFKPSDPQWLICRAALGEIPVPT